MRKAARKIKENLGSGKKKIPPAVAGSSGKPIEKKEERTRKPTPFKPEPPASTFWQRCSWQFTGIGRVRLRIIHYCRKAPGNPAWKNLERDAVLLAKIRQTRKVDVSGWHEFVLGCLANHYVHANDLDKALDWVKQLGKDFSDSVYIHRLRWGIVKKALEGNASDVFFSQAKHFLVDDHVTADHIDAVHSILLHAYEKGTTRKCVEILDSANANISKSPAMLCAKALCTMPPKFTGKEQAREWAGKIHPDALAFSKRMHADALIVSARAAEWSGNFDAMAELAEKAYRIDPPGPGLNYWRLRSLLQKAVFSGNRLAEEPLPDVPGQEWNRFRLEYALYMQPDLKSAENLLPVFTSDVSGMEDPERLLTLKILEKPLTVSFSSTADVIMNTARICQEIERLTGKQLPWTQYSLAVKELLTDNALEKALERFENIQVSSNISTIPVLARVARLILGQPKNCTSLENTLFEGMDETLFLHIPLLSELRKLVNLAHRAIDHDGSVCKDILEHRMSPTAPPWFSWLFVRTCVLALKPDDFISILNRLEFTNKVIAWEIARWAAEGSPFSSKQNPAILKATDMLEGNDWHSFCESSENMVGLGILPDAMLSNDRCLSAGFSRVRHAIKEWDMTSAGNQLADMLKHLDISDPIIRSWWEPLCEYWLGVAEAHIGKSEAAIHLGKTVESWMGSRARSQLALLAVRDKNYQQAGDWLQEAHPGYPGVQYARALILARTGEAGAARDIINGYTDLFPGDTSPYSSACKRFLAALDERSGAQDEAKAKYMNQHAADPDDPTAAARLARILLQDLYQVTGKISEEEHLILGAILAGSETIQKRTPWFRSFAQLAGLMLIHSATESLSSKTGLDSTQVRIAVRQLLYYRKTKEAMQILARYDLDDQASYTKAILDAWHLLGTIWERGAVSETFEGRNLSDALDTCLDHLAVTGRKNGTRESSRWSSLLQLAKRMVQNPRDYSSLSSQELLDQFRSINPDGLNEQQQNMASAIDSLSRGEKARFLEAYQSLSHDLDTLPVDGRDLWIAAAEQWFETGQWDELLESDLPACIEDLSDPHVRTMIGMAYAQACTIDISKGDMGRAAQNLNRARSTLEPLFEELGV